MPAATIKAPSCQLHSPTFSPSRPGSCATRQTVLQRTAFCNPSNTAPIQPWHNPIPRRSATLSQPQMYPACPVLFNPPRAVSNRVHRSTTCNALTHARTLRHGSGGTVRELLPPLPPPPPPPSPPIPHWDGTPTHPEVAAVRVAWRAPSSQKPASQSVRHFPPSDPCDFSLSVLVLFLGSYIVAARLLATRPLPNIG